MRLHAGNGLVLTQSADIPMKERLFLTHVQITSMEEAQNWKEITIKQRDEMLAAASVIDVDDMNVDSIRRMDAIVTKVTEHINDVPMSVEESLELVDYFPKWKEGEPMPTGRKVSYNGSLFEVVQEHTSQTDWNPCDAKSLFKVVQVEAEGTEYDVIQWEQGMVLEEGKFYEDNMILYKCIRDSGTPLYYALDVLVGNYVEVIE